MGGTTLTARYEHGEYLRRVPDWHAADAPWKAGQVLRLLDAHGVRPASLCEVGCGAGEILARLQERMAGVERLVGYDISGQAIALCRPKERENLRFHHGDFLTESRDCFELILLLDVLEHVGDYLGFLSALSSRARRFVFHIPLDLSVQAVAQRSRHPLSMRERYGHLHYFTAETALSTLADAGYRVEATRYTWDNEVDGWPPLRPGPRAALKYPLRCLAQGLEQLAFRARPELVARLRPGFNLLVLASPAEGRSASEPGRTPGG